MDAMSDDRRLWCLLPGPRGQAAMIDVRLDDERHLQHQQTAALLQRIGVDVTRYSPPPRRLRSEQRSAHHVGLDDDIETLVLAAQESELDKAYRELLASRSPIRVRCRRARSG
jgi:hypothetical protein